MAKELTACVVVDVGDGKEIPFEELSNEQLKQFRDNCSRRLTRVMSDYYSRHPDELRSLMSIEMKKPPE